MTIPKALEKLLLKHEINFDIEDILSDTSDGGIWLLKINDDQPYATVGPKNYQLHDTYTEALNRSVRALLENTPNQALVNGKPIKMDVSMLPDDLSEALFLRVCPDFGQVPRLDVDCYIIPLEVNGFIVNGQKWTLASAFLSSPPFPPTGTSLKYAGRFKDKIIFSAPKEMLENREFPKVIHETMMVAHKQGIPVEGLKPVLLSEEIKVCRAHRKVS